MFKNSDYDKLKQIMNESPEKEELLLRLLDSHQMSLSMISHEIRNPLTLVYSSLQFIESMHPEVHNFRYWSDMHQDIEYLILLLDELSAYNNGSKLHLSVIDSGIFFQRLVLSFAASLSAQNIEFVSKLSPSLPFIECDEIKLREVFTNLLTNAREALLTDSDYYPNYKPRIRFSVSANSDHLHITIEDNGCGIPNEHIDNIFEPFVTYKKNGTGLGLAITARIIESHHGTISVSSSPGTGTTFTLTLPVKQDTQYKTGC